MDKVLKILGFLLIFPATFFLAKGIDNVLDPLGKRPEILVVTQKFSLGQTTTIKVHDVFEWTNRGWMMKPVSYQFVEKERYILQLEGKGGTEVFIDDAHSYRQFAVGNLVNKTRFNLRLATPDDF